nr:MAG TPA: hypothetical protein [Caudoviricetes sp.]
MACAGRFGLWRACWPLASACEQWLVGHALEYRLRIFLKIFEIQRYISLCKNRAAGKQVRGAYPQNTIEATPVSRDPRNLTGRAHGAVGHVAE